MGRSEARAHPKEAGAMPVPWPSDLGQDSEIRNPG